VSRDRILLSVLAGVAVVVGFWFAILAPKRADLHQMDADLAVQQQRLRRAQATVAQARAARVRYAADYSAVVTLGQAVPAQDGLPSLLYQIDSSARDAKIDFASMTSGSPTTDTAGSTATTTAAASSPDAAAATAATAPTPMPLSFVFNGSFFEMEHMLDRVQRFVRTRGADVAVSGRLVSVDDIQLAPAAQGFPRVQATINASAYTMPAPRTLATGSATAASTTTGAATTSNPTTATGTTP
jgi:Tfp pilus assembly protein PilO